MDKISKHDVQVRELRREDLPNMIKYFFESSAEFMNSIGLRVRGTEEAESFRERWTERLVERENGGRPIEMLTVLNLGEVIGYHTSTHHEGGRSLIMHAHFFNENLRGKGIGTISYVLAIEKFLIDYGYEEVIFKTPKQNAAPMRIKEKLGLEAIGEEVIDWAQLVKPLEVKVFRVTRSELPKLKARIGI